MILLYSDVSFFQTPAAVQFIEQADENNTIKCRHVNMIVPWVYFVIYRSDCKEK